MLGGEKKRQGLQQQAAGFWESSAMIMKNFSYKTAILCERKANACRGGTIPKQIRRRQPRQILKFCMGL